MQRELSRYLREWKESRHRLPLLVRGARQVGKTFTVEAFGKECFGGVATANFELHPELKVCFESLDPRRVVSSLEVNLNQRIVPGETLLFLDEIQECPRALMALRYFKEQLPELHVIGAGSLLEFALHDTNFSYPVGRVEFLHMLPLSFREYLTAMGQERACAALEHASCENPPERAVHEKLLELVREYVFVGGMPAVVERFRDNHSSLAAGQLQQALFQGYRNDFGKYAPFLQHKYLQKVFERAPQLVAKHFQYTKVDPEMRARELKRALDDLCHAGLVTRIYATQANGLPLQAEKKFKLLFLDVGLLRARLGISSIQGLHEGALAEQFVGQELLAYQNPILDRHLYFWERQKKGSSAEVDYITTFGATLVPIEVKAGAEGHLKSLHLFLKERNCPLGIRVSKGPLAWNPPILSVPFYLLSELPRLLSSL